MDVIREKSIIQQYLHDESNLFLASEDSIEAAYFPRNEIDIVEIMQEANKSGKFITTSGGGTGITGSRVPMLGGFVVSMEKMLSTAEKPDYERITHKGTVRAFDFEINRNTGRAWFPPGISLQELADALPPEFFYPPDPTETGASLGGTVATNASGAKSFYYGSTRDWITGLNIVLANGKTLKLKRGDIVADNDEFNFQLDETRYNFKIPNYRMPALKNAAGLYSKEGMDLIDLFIGSEGIFGIFSEIEVKLEKKDIEIISDLAFFDDEARALAFVDELRPRKEQGILSLEFFDKNALDFIRQEYPNIQEGLGAAVFLELFNIDETLGLLSEALEKHRAREDWCATTPDNIRDLKEFRHALPDSVNSYLKQHRSYKLGTDFVVPQDRFAEMLAAYKKIGESYKNNFKRDGTHYVLYGHIGDCHLHFNFITHTEEEQKAAKELYLELARTALSLGGTISGEHGVGKKTMIKDGEEIPYLELMYGKPGLREIARIKKVFDPNGILNIGNMIPMDYA